MERREEKNHRGDSPHNSGEHHKKKKSHKRRYNDSSSAEEEDSNKRRHHKHRRNKVDRQHHNSDNIDSNTEDQLGEGGQRDRNHNSESNEEEQSRRINNSRHHKHNAEIDSSGRHRESRHHRQFRRSSAEFDPAVRIKREKDDDNFREQQRERLGHDQRRREARRERDRAGGDYGLNTDAPQVKSEPGVRNPEAAGGKENTSDAATDRQQPNFDLSGKLTEDTNTFRGVVIKYNEPPEAMKPKRRWRLYPFKGQESLPVLHIHRQSAFLLGRDRRIADIPVDHPSCSKQQAVLQFRAMPYTRPDGTPGRRVRPYIIDLESANGTYINGEKVEAKRYYELREKDVIKFGFSSREYVLLHDAVDLSEVAAGEDMEEA
ncbi:smad nuclear-interacting protein 1 [Plakobranchus ocellatus]|uniref:Smad nuclear-interacting protein 1 n=1 Tax=Plakobranchus ocellatus TaxID=259542 RepID=A0AAV3ZSZ5_9GAST|nr:smad nuclear-interacting protein 1 [Plakobranchus ocellatus]